MIRQEIENTACGKFSKVEFETGSQSFCPGADFIGFNGHFPGFPVLPAMLQVLFGIMVTEKISATRLILKKLDRAKFMMKIKPEEALTVTCKVTPPADNQQNFIIKSNVTIEVSGEKAATMTLFLEPFEKLTF